MTVRRPSMFTAAQSARSTTRTEWCATCGVIFAEVDHVAGRVIGQLPELGDDRRGFGEADLRAALAERPGGRGGEFPIDELRHATNRTRRAPALNATRRTTTDRV